MSPMPLRSPWFRLAETRPQVAGVKLVAGVINGVRWMNALYFNDDGDIHDGDQDELPPVEWWADPPVHPAEEIS